MDQSGSRNRGRPDAIPPRHHDVRHHARRFGGAGGKAHFHCRQQADGYGVDRCLASGDRCGNAAATAYCKSREFAQASSYRQVDKDEITGAIPANAGGCKGGTCEQFIAIECSR